MLLRPFDLYCKACFGILSVSILCTCCSHVSWYCFISFTIFCAPVFPNTFILFFLFIIYLFILYLFIYLSSSCSLRIRCVSCSLIRKMKLVPPSLPLSSYVPSSFQFILYCLFRYPVCVHPLYVLYPFFLILFYFFYYILCSRFFPNTWIFSLSSFVIPSRCLKNFICAACQRIFFLFFSTQASLLNFNAALAVML
jgi:hypothetical protein